MKDAGLPDETFRMAVVGVGNMGAHHVNAISRINGAALAAIVDTRAAARDALAAKHGCPALADYRDLAPEAFDAVSICVPTALHREVAEHFIRLGKHVLVEKPIAPSVADARAMQAAARAAGVALMVGHLERFNPAMMKVKQILSTGEVGHIVSVIAQRIGPFPRQIKDSDITVDLAIHDIDLVSNLIGSVPDSVTTNKRRTFLKYRDDSVDLFLRYGDVTAFIQANWIAPIRKRKLHISCTEGQIELDFIAQTVNLWKSRYRRFLDPDAADAARADYVVVSEDPEHLVLEVRNGNALADQIRMFIHRIRAGLPIENDFSINALKIALDQGDSPD